MSDEEKTFNLSIVADRKGYFQQYIYHNVKKDYASFEANTKRKALRLFRKDVSELRATPEDELSPEEKKFLADYDLYCPVIDGVDTINRICHRVENEFRSYVTNKKSEVDFDTSILKSGTYYSERQYKAIKKIYKEYKERQETYSRAARKKRIDAYDMNEQFYLMKEDFRKRCEAICPNSEMLCDIIVDIAYARENSRQFAWDVCGDQIIANLLAHNDNMISMPVEDEDGDVEFRGHKYRFEKVPYIMEENYTEVSSDEAK